MKFAATLFLLAGLTVSLAAQQLSSLPQVLSESEERLAAATTELSESRAAMRDEIVPLSDERDALFTQAESLRIEERRLRNQLDNEALSLSQLQESLDARERTNTYLSGILRDWVQNFSAGIHISELQIYSDAINAANAGAEANLPQAEEYLLQLAVLDQSIDRLANVIGGATFSGEAKIDVPGSESRGFIVEGNIALFGPWAFFSSAEGSGVARTVSNTTEAVVVGVADGIYNDAIASVTTSGSGMAPFDSTNGKAFDIEAVQETIQEHIAKGGLVMIPILGLFSFAMLVALFKMYEIFSVRKARQADLDNILDHLEKGDKDAAMAYAKSVKGPVGQLLQAAVKHSDNDREVIEEVLYERIIKTQPKLERFLPLIAVTAATAPLLGLLGTVTGMIKTFKLITVFGTGDANNLASGISEALITTEFGLIVAIPTLILHALLSRAAKGVIGSMEQTAVGFINGLSEIDEDTSDNDEDAA